MTHGFDDEGSKYDGNGNLREWQTAEDRKKPSPSAPTAKSTSTAASRRLRPTTTCPRQSSTASSPWAKTPPTTAACASPTWRCSIRLAEEGKIHRRQDRRLHRGAALLPRLRPGLVPESDRAVGPPVGADRSPLARPLARQRLGAELRRVRQGLRLHTRASRCTPKTPAASGRRFNSFAAAAISRRGCGVFKAFPQRSNRWQPAPYSLS